jgi:hypothetical protein
MTVINPFSTRFVRPGAVAFLFPEGWSAERLVARLEERGWWGEVQGPHGSGKSTLVQRLLPEIRRRGREVQLHTLNRGQRRLEGAGASGRGWHAATQVVVDGYEQLGWWPRRRLLQACRRHGAGLLATVHRPSHLPVLWQTEPTLEMTHRLVQHLLAGTPSLVLDETDVVQAYHRHKANIREILFNLYDVYEQRATAANGIATAASRQP